MNYSDEELQKRIDENQSVNSNDLDVRAYQHVFNALSSTPDETLPGNFADKIIGVIQAKQKKESSRDAWLFGLGMFFLVIAFIVAVVYTGFKMELGFLKSMSTWLGLFVFGVGFVIVLNLLERKLIHRQS